ncbi:hypothetical protein SEUCBS140593_002745 [Sporothrix eucalyptigena]|uniref:Uncharacterized protein n=1 Tax=Sporothrix eucalyptigena TaxID=1812306 RepID=A0ABP0B924_9PEZI
MDMVDWSPSGPWDKHRRIYGIKEFAAVVTHLAFQKQHVDFRRKIMPHHVFQLQCIVDSMTVSRGWSLSILRGHVLQPPARGFRPRRDVDLFLDRENERVGNGFLQAVEIFKQMSEKDSLLHGNLTRHKLNYDLLEAVQYDFINWLGESKYMHGLTGIPQSRFASSNANGLWEYSPFLCGTGLEEALTESYRCSILVMDRIPEPIMIIHLHNMLVQKGYITRPVGLYATLQELYPEAFFANGIVPKSNFREALDARAAQISRRRSPHSQPVSDDDRNSFFKKKSLLMALRQADWDIDCIPGADVPMPSITGTMKIGQTKVVVDPTTGKKRLMDTDFVRSIKTTGKTDADIMKIHAIWQELQEFLRHESEVFQMQHITNELLTSMNLEGYKHISLSKRGKPGERGSDAMSTKELLSMLRVDLVSDVCGDIPISSFNYVWGMINCMMMFICFEDKLESCRNPVYVEVYEKDPLWETQKRVGLATMAMHTQDEECLRIMAKEFTDKRLGFMSHIYWKDLEQTTDKPTKVAGQRLPEEDTCVVM